MDRIINLKIVLQTPVGSRAVKDVVRKGRAGGQFRNREIEIQTDIETGAGSDANNEVRRVIFETLKKKVHKRELLFYVVAEFESDGTNNYFKTIVPRSEIPLQLRRV